MRTPFLLFLLSLFPLSLSAEYYVLPLQDLALQAKPREVARVMELKNSYSLWGRGFSSINVRVAKEVSSYVSSARVARWFRDADSEMDRLFDEVLEMHCRVGDHQIAFEARAGSQFSGYLDIQVHPQAAWVSHKFTVNTATLKPVPRKRYERVRADAATVLLFERLGGQGWFRQYLDDQELDLEAGNEPDRQLEFGLFVDSKRRADERSHLFNAEDVADRTIELGALRAPRLRQRSTRSKKVRSELMLGGVESAIPQDQYCCFAGSIEGMSHLLKELEEHLGGYFQAGYQQYQWGDLVACYLDQMAVPHEDLMECGGLVEAVAITGSDFNFHLGADVGLVMESNQASSLFKRLREIQSRSEEDHQAVFGRLGKGWQQSVLVSSNGEISSYLGMIGKVVVLANSPAQFRRLKKTMLGKSVSLARNKKHQQLREGRVTGPAAGWFSMGDKALERMMGPAMRIASARRHQAMVAHQHLLYKELRGLPWKPQDYQSVLGQVSFDQGVPRSGRLHRGRLYRPVIDWPLRKVSQLEATAYKGWVESNECALWMGILKTGIDFEFDDEGVQIELGVGTGSLPWPMAQAFALIGEGQISAQSQMRREGEFLSLTASVDIAELSHHLGFWFLEKEELFDWAGESWTFYVERSPLLGLLGDTAVSQPLVQIVQQQAGHLGLGVRIERRAGKSVEAFEQAFERMYEAQGHSLESKTFEQVPYVRINPANDSLCGVFEGYSPCYAFMRGAFLIAVDEAGIRRAILHEKKLAKSKRLTVAKSQAKLHGQWSLLPQMAEARLRRQQSLRMIPLLNEWKRVMSEEAFDHFLKGHLGNGCCPGGMGYRWNEEMMTMESIAFGFPANQRSGPVKQSFAKYGQVAASCKMSAGSGKFNIRLSKITQPDFANRVHASGRGKGLVVDQVAFTKPGVKAMYQTYLSGMSCDKETLQREAHKDGRLEVLAGQVVRQPFSQLVPIRRRYAFQDGLRLRSVEWTNIGKKLAFGSGWRVFPKELKVGYRESQSGKATLSSAGQQHEGVVHSHCHVVGYQDVKIPVGMVPDCLQIEYRWHHYFHGVISSEKLVWWVHPELGLVKSESWADGQFRTAHLVDLVSSEKKEGR